jgi:hypothetical protein
MSKTVACLAVALSMFMAPPSLFAKAKKIQNPQSPLSVDFDMFHSDNNDEIQPRIAVEYVLETTPLLETDEKELKIGSYYFDGSAKARLVHAWGSDLNNEPTFLESQYGILWNMSHVEERDELPGGTKTKVAGSLPPLPPVDEKKPSEIENPLDYNYGVIKLQGSLAADTNDSADNTNIYGGIVAIYAENGAFPDWDITIPSFLAGLDYVSPQSADLREEIGVGTSSFPRFRGAILWSWDFGAKLDLKNSFAYRLGLLIYYQYVKQFDQEDEWKNRGYDEYDLASFKLLYRFEMKNVNKWGLRNIFAGYSTGRLIDYEEDDNRFIIGITLQ